MRAAGVLAKGRMFDMPGLMALVCAGHLFTVWHMRGGGNILQADRRSKCAYSSVVTLYFKRHKYVFLSHYNIFIPSNASPDMQFHAVHAVSHL